MRVNCAAPDSVPARADHTYEGVGYMLKFEVENYHADEEMDDVDPQDGPGGDDDTHPKDDGKKKDYDSTSGANGKEKAAEPKPKESSNKNSDQTKALDTKEVPILFGSFDRDFSTPRAEGKVRLPHFGSLPTFHACKVKLPHVGALSAPRRLWSDMVEEKEPAERVAAAMTPKVNCADSGRKSVAIQSTEAPSSVVTPEKTENVCAQKSCTELPATVLTSADDTVKTVYYPVVNEDTCSGGQTTLPESQIFVLEVPTRSSAEARTAVTPLNSHSSPSKMASPGLRFTSLRQKAKGVSPSASRSSSPRSPYTSGGSVCRDSPSTPSKGTGVFLGGRYSQEEIIAYGGIPEAKAAEVRSSSRVRAQANADDTQLARAQKRAQDRDDLQFSGYSDGYSLDPYVVLPTTNGQARRNGFWVQPPGINRIGSICPVQLAF